jgi:hypothetical protein
MNLVQATLPVQQQGMRHLAAAEAVSEALSRQLVPG